MSVQVQHEENFLHLIYEKYTSADDDISLHAAEDESWVILESTDGSLNSDGLDLVTGLADKCKERGGLLILTGDFPDLIKDIENITWISSFDEAVDYVFIEQLERELGDE